MTNAQHLPPGTISQGTGWGNPGGRGMAPVSLVAMAIRCGYRRVEVTSLLQYLSVYPTVRQLDSGRRTLVYIYTSHSTPLNWQSSQQRMRKAQRVITPKIPKTPKSWARVVKTGRVERSDSPAPSTLKCPVRGCRQIFTAKKVGSIAGGDRRGRQRGDAEGKDNDRNRDGPFDFVNLYWVSTQSHRNRVLSDGTIGR